MPHARHGRPSGSRHHHRSTSSPRRVRRARLSALAAVAAAGLAVAFWLPGRDDSASASTNGLPSSLSHHRDRHGPMDWLRNRHHGNDRHSSDRQFPGSRPTASPSSAPPSEEPPTTEPPTSEPPTTEPPTSEPPTVAPTPTATTPSPTPTSAPAARKWAAFTDYAPGQVVTFKGTMYEVLQAHTSLPGWEPPAVPALFAETG